MRGKISHLLASFTCLDFRPQSAIVDVRVRPPRPLFSRLQKRRQRPRISLPRRTGNQCGRRSRVKFMGSRPSRDKSAVKKFPLARRRAHAHQTALLENQFPGK
jgi:hypothetical protein